MSRKKRTPPSLALACALALSGCAQAKRPSGAVEGAGGATGVQFVRSATVAITYKNVKILVDPILADAGTEPPIDYSNEKKNPAIGLPVEKSELLNGLSAVLLTHYHSDHFDGEAERVLPKDILIFCQPYDEAKLREKGFSNLRPVGDTVSWEGVTISRFSARHHEGATGLPPFGESSSFFVQTKDRALFFTGDAIFDDRLRGSLLAVRPEAVVANAGECQFTKENPLLAPGTPMTLTAAELKEMAKTLPGSRIIAVHMDAINHCRLTKGELRAYVEGEGLGGSVVVPNEGDALLPRF